MRGILALLFIAAGISLAAGATIFGYVFDADTFEVAEGVVVEINTTPLQRAVSDDEGAYSFEVPSGTYELTARQYRERALYAKAGEQVNISGEGRFRLDLLVLPVAESYENGIEEIEFGGEEIIEGAQQKIDYGVVAVVAALLFVAGAGAAYVRILQKWRGKNGMKERTGAAEGARVEREDEFGAKRAGGTGRGGRGKVEDERGGERGEGAGEETGASWAGPVGRGSASGRAETRAKARTGELSHDLRELVKIIKGHEGWVSQKELRKGMPFSEAKVSLMLTELENLGIVKRIKKGRGNVIRLMKGS